jgi:hypothetical protein
LSVARVNQHTQVLELLREFGALEHETSLLDELDIDTSFTTPEFSILIDTTVDHPGAGSYLIDDAFSDKTIDQLVSLYRLIPTEAAPRQKKGPCSVRSYFCDAHGAIQKLLLSVLDSGRWKHASVLPHMRFLCYSEPDTVLAPHVDLCRVDIRSGERSTHSFLLYLTDCKQGGQTTLLSDLSSSSEALARVSPKRGRLLLFKHACPHSGESVVDVPKLLIRGEVLLRESSS